MKQAPNKVLARAYAWLVAQEDPISLKYGDSLAALLLETRRDALEEAAGAADKIAVARKRSANQTANEGEGDLGSIEAATCLDAEAAGARAVAAAIRALAEEER